MSQVLGSFRANRRLPEGETGTWIVPNAHHSGAYQCLVIKSLNQPESAN